MSVKDPTNGYVIYKPPLMQSCHRLCIVSSQLGLVLTMAPHGHMTLLPPASSLQSGWLMNGDLPKTFQLYLSLSLMMKGNETFKVYIHHFVFRTSYILYKLQCNISCGGHAVFSIGHISLLTEVKC